MYPAVYELSSTVVATIFTMVEWSLAALELSFAIVEAIFAVVVLNTAVFKTNSTVIRDIGTEAVWNLAVSAKLHVCSTVLRLMGSLHRGARYRCQVVGFKLQEVICTKGGCTPRVSSASPPAIWITSSATCSAEAS